MIKILPKKLSNIQPSYKKIVFAFTIAFIIFLISPNKESSILIFTFVPVSIMFTNYIESIQKYWIKESIIVGVIGLSFITFILQLL
jgi:hypothetical protein